MTEGSEQPAEKDDVLNFFFSEIESIGRYNIRQTYLAQTRQGAMVTSCRLVPKSCVLDSHRRALQAHIRCSSSSTMPLRRR